MSGPVPDTGQVTTTPQAPPVPTGKQKRGRETAGDMLRSLAVVMVLVLGLWFFAQAPESDEAAIRVGDPTAELNAFTAAVPGAPSLAPLPAGWQPTSSRLGRAPDTLNVGHVTPSREYAELAATTAPPAEALPALLGQASPAGTVQVEGEPWERYDEADGSTSLVRSFGRVTVVVGTLRATASDEELLVLAGAVGRR